MNEEEYRKEDLKLRRTEIATNVILTLGIILISLLTFLKQYPDYLYNSIGIIVFILIVLFLWRFLSPIRTSSNIL